MPAPARFPVICGPTASGKSALAIALARLLSEKGRSAEIISADAFHIYRGMDIGTAKPSVADRAEFPHHLIDIVDPSERFTVDDWLRRCEAALQEIRVRGAIPIVVGGTHLYIKALLDGLFEGPEPDPQLRAALAALPPEARRAELERTDPAAAARIHPNDARRTIRALEVFRQTGKPISQWQGQWDKGGRADALLVILQWPTESLNRRINARVKAMIEAGLVEEVAHLLARGGPSLGPQAREALGYKQFMEWIALRDRPNGEVIAISRTILEYALDQIVERIKIETRRFAKNQRTWQKRLSATPGTVALNMETTPINEAAQRIFTALNDSQTPPLPPSDSSSAPESFTPTA